MKESIKSSFLKKEIFDPNQKLDLNKVVLILRKMEELQRTSELGLLMALIDAKENNEKIFLVKDRTSKIALNSGFSFKNDTY